jgi:AcrR family transcriptional regulator
MLAARSRRGRTNSRGDATREQILEAAVELLGEMGYAGLSISAVCDRADVAPTAIYWHFGNKAGLMEAVIARIGGYSEHILAEVAAAEPAERLDRLIAEIRALGSRGGWLRGGARR